MNDSRQLKEDWRTLVLGLPGVATLVGDRVYPLIAADGAEPPYIAYRIADREDEATQGGLTGAGKFLMELELITPDPDTGDELASALNAGLSGTRPGTVGGTVFETVFAEGEMEEFDFESRSYSKTVGYRVRARAAD